MLVPLLRVVRGYVSWFIVSARKQFLHDSTGQRTGQRPRPCPGSPKCFMRSNFFLPVRFLVGMANGAQVVRGAVVARVVLDLSLERLGNPRCGVQNSPPRRD